LPAGNHTISLVVNDGTSDSVPDQVTISVVEAIEAKMDFYPPVMDSRSTNPFVYAVLRLPPEFKDQVDLNQIVLLYLGSISSNMLTVYSSSDFITVAARFDKTQLLNVVNHNGKVEMTLLGKINTGQNFYGSSLLSNR
jgi:hypothetical protein